MIMTVTVIGTMIVGWSWLRHALASFS